MIYHKHPMGHKHPDSDARKALPPELSQKLSEWGRKGGKVTSKAKRNAVRQNILRALAKKFPHDPRYQAYRSPQTSESTGRNGDAS